MNRRIISLFLLCLLSLFLLTACQKQPVSERRTEQPGLIQEAQLPDASAMEEAPAKEEVQSPGRLGFAGANLGQGGLMAGDGEWVYFRSETDWGLYKARTDGSERTQLLPPEDYRLLCRITLEGATHLEVARELGISVWSSQKRLQRIRKKLCKQLLPNKSKKISENMSVLRF